MTFQIRKVLTSLVPVFVLLLCFAIFSGYTVLAKIALSGGTNPLVLAFLREVIAASVLMSGMVFIERRKPKGLQRFVPSIEDSGNFMVLGAVMVYGVQLISALALSRVTALNYALFAPLVPVLTTSLALAVRMERFERGRWPSWLKIGGILVAVVGAVVTAFGAVGHASGAGVSSDAVVLGNVLLLLNKLCISVYPLLEKRLFARGYSPLFVVAWGYVTGSALTLLAVVPCTLSAAAWTVPRAGWVAILYAGCLSSGFNYAAMAWVNKRTTPVLVMAFYPSQSVFTPLLSYFFLGTTPALEEGLGGAVIVVGLLGVAGAKWAESRAGTGGPAAAALAAHDAAATAAALPSADEDGATSGSGAAAALEEGGVVMTPAAATAAAEGSLLAARAASSPAPRDANSAGGDTPVVTTNRGGVKRSGATGAYFAFDSSAAAPPGMD